MIACKANSAMSNVRIPKWLFDCFHTGISFNGVCIVDGYIKSFKKLEISKSPAMIRKNCQVHELQWYFKHFLSQFK